MARRWTNPAASAWRSMAAAAHAARGEQAAAAAMVRDATDRARSWGAPLTRARVHLLAARSGCGDVARHLAEAVAFLPGGTGRSAVTPPARTDWHDPARDKTGRDKTGRDKTARDKTGRRGTGGAPSLSAADERLATLVAAGWSNADVARFLSVGTRTVEARLTAIYRLLALTGRRQLAEMFPPPPWRGDLRHDTETWFLRNRPPNATNPGLACRRG
jgi:DNA-binding CsgD family transcriptional regulator